MEFKSRSERRGDTFARLGLGAGGGRGKWGPNNPHLITTQHNKISNPWQSPHRNSLNMKLASNHAFACASLTTAIPALKDGELSSTSKFSVPNSDNHASHIDWRDMVTPNRYRAPSMLKIAGKIYITLWPSHCGI